uniref:Olfactory receptor 26 n=1 Tax=Meteorus pulchricornis TaxID=51522 RepID=A0A1S5VFL5_9HYME|nr:olfactory receptor 26 [Meteorus pulchricornis]
MDIFETPYFYYSKRFGVMFGHWPFLSPIRRNCVKCLVLVLISSILLPKLIKLIEVIHDIDGIIECVPMIGLHIGSLTKFFNWIVNSNKMKHLLMRIQRDWNNLKVTKDIEVMHEFYERGRLFTMAYATAMFSILGLYLASPSIPRLMDILYPHNESRGRIYLYQTEYFVDQDEYYLLILIHAYMTVPISLGVHVFVDNMFTMYIHHACGLFAALKLRMESLHINDIDYRENKSTKSAEVFHRIVMCVDMHENVIEYVKRSL